MRSPFFYTLARFRARQAVRADLRAKGHALWATAELVTEAMDACDDELIDLAVAQADAQCDGKVSAALAQPVAGLGDGKILEWLTEFFNSELGKLLIEVLKALLLSLLVV